MNVNTHYMKIPFSVYAPLQTSEKCNVLNAKPKIVHSDRGLPVTGTRVYILPLDSASTQTQNKKTKTGRLSVRLVMYVKYLIQVNLAEIERDEYYLVRKTVLRMNICGKIALRTQNGIND